MEQEFLAADKHYRKRILMVLILVIISISLIILIAIPALNGLIQKMELEKAMKTTATILFFLFLIPIPLGFKFLSISNRILRENRYPPEGMKVIHDMVIIRGDKAKLRAYIFLLLAFLIFFISVFCAFSAHLFLKILTTTGSFL
jgi:hypothetical protein